MKQSGIMFTCDKCKKMQFEEMSVNDIKLKILAKPNNWGYFTILGKDYLFCDDCIKKCYEIKNKYENELCKLLEV